MLLLLRRRRAHGYGLVRQLEALGITGDNRGRVYRALRRLEEMGFVACAWDKPTVGPARRVCEILPAGTCALDSVVPTLRSAGYPDDDLVAGLVMGLAREAAMTDTTTSGEQRGP